MRHVVAAFLVSGACGLSWAQTVNPHNGTWTVKFSTERRVDLSGTVVIDREVGTWQVVAQSVRDPCIGKKSPLVVTKATDDELEFEVQRSKVLVGCPDFTARFRKVDERTLAATFGGGRPVIMTRD